MGGLLPMVPMLSAVLPEQQEYASLLPFELSGALDLAGLAIATWTLWVFLSLPLQGTLRRAFRFISLASLALAFSHVLDSLVQALGLLPFQSATLLHQGEMLVSMLLFVPGMASLAESFSRVSPSTKKLSSHLWSMTIGFITGVASLSFIIYGIAPEAEAVAFAGINTCLIVLAGISCWLLVRARIRSVVGWSLWLAVLGLVIFSLAHPLQAWSVLQPGDSTYGPVFHRLLVMPAFFLFALSITHLARRLSQNVLPQGSVSEEVPQQTVPLLRVTTPIKRRSQTPTRVLDSSRLR
jgi:hypothetical protein